MKILIAGFQHETNTFAPTKASYENFVRGEGQPAMVRGADVLGLRDVNVPIGGFILACERDGHALVPVIWAAASPSAQVTEDAYERIAGEIVEAAKRGGFDAVYLDLHGAMVADHAEDGEGELLAHVRAAVGPSVPVVASLDLHANVTERMLASADAIVAYRTYPHVDMAATGERTAGLLTRILGGHKPLAHAAKRVPFLIPINGMCTMLEPAQALYERLAALERGPVVSLSIAMGFPAADFPGCGPVIWGYGEDAEAVEQAVADLNDAMVGNEAAWSVPFLTPDEAVAEAMRLAEGAAKPVVIADTQDNPGAGANSDTMGMLRALLRHDAKGAALGLIWDPEAVGKAHAAGVGATLELALGGRSGAPGDEPFVGMFEVVTLSDGRCRYDGPMFNGMQAQLGPVAGLRIAGVDIAVASTKAQMLDRNLYRVAGIVPEAMKILVNKSSVHFRADFEPIAEAILVAIAPGPMTANPADLPWTRLMRGIRVAPSGASFGG